MYCPQCATDNLDNASFCRGCGANIRLVSQALTGTLPPAALEESGGESSKGRHGRRKNAPSVETGIKNIFMGLAFVVVALCVRFYMPGGFAWWFWMLFPAITMLGGGVAELVRLKMEKAPSLPTALPAAFTPAAMPLRAARPSALPQRNAADLYSPPSVTEGTTRHLGGELPTMHLEDPIESKPEKL